MTLIQSHLATTRINSHRLLPALAALALLSCLLVACGDAAETKQKQEKKPLFNTEEFSQQNIPVLSAPHSTGLKESFKSEDLEFTLEPKEGVEYMFDMEKDATLFYSWTSETRELTVDFHGHPGKVNKDDYPKGFWFRYQPHGLKEHNGKIVAPIKGKHGWYFKNNSRKPATIKLRVAGDYDEFVIIK